MLNFIYVLPNAQTGVSSPPPASLTVEDVVTDVSVNLTVGVGTQQKTSGTGGQSDSGGMSNRAINSGTGYIQAVKSGSGGNSIIALDDHWLENFEDRSFRHAFRTLSNLTWHVYECGQIRHSGTYTVDVTVFRVQVEDGAVSYYVDQNGTDDFVKVYENPYLEITYPCFFSSTFSGFSRPITDIKIAGTDLIDNTSAIYLDQNNLITNMTDYTSGDATFDERYNAFSSALINPDTNNIDVIFRSGLTSPELTGHLTDGQMAKLSINPTTGVRIGSPVYIRNHPGHDYRDPTVAYIDGTLVLNTQKWQGDTGETRLGTYFHFSEDNGSTWQYWNDSTQSLTSNEADAYDISGEFTGLPIKTGFCFGKYVPSGNPNEWLCVLYYAAAINGNPWQIMVLRSSDKFHTFTYHHVFDMDLPVNSGLELSETVIIGIGSDKFILLSRDLEGPYGNGNGLYQLTTSDNFANFSNWSQTGMPIKNFHSIPRGIYDSETDEVILVYQNRGYGCVMVSVTDATQAFNGNWSEPKFLYINRHTGGFGGGIGYPDIIKVSTDSYFIIMSYEGDNATSGDIDCHQRGRLFNRSDFT